MTAITPIMAGITIVDVQPTETTSTFVFGNKMGATGQGQKQAVPRPGSQVTTTAGKPPTPPTIAPPGSLHQISHLEGEDLLHAKPAKQNNNCPSCKSSSL